MTLAPWQAYLDMLAPAGKLVERSWEAESETNRADLYRQLMMNLALGYFVYFQADPDHPEFAPFLNSIFLLQPNPDDTYYYAPVSGEGAYRLSGDRGSVRLLTLTIGRRMIGMVEEPAGQLGEYDIGRMVEDDGQFDLLLSAERPDGYEGLWLEMDRRCEFLLVRQRSYDWGAERDARLAIQRIDPVPPKPRMGVVETDRAMRQAIAFAERLSRQWLDHVNRIKDKYPPNIFHFTGFTEFGGVKAQVYWEAIYDFAEDEALILESDLPDEARYWNVQLNDSIWNTIEYVYRQSSLNGAQAKIDGDGKFRAVIAASDPGVANWLDTQGRTLGTVVGRWYQCSSHPEPVLKKVKLADLAAHLPADTSRVSAEERRLALLERSRGAQIRRRW